MTQLEPIRPAAVEAIRSRKPAFSIVRDGDGKLDGRASRIRQRLLAWVKPGAKVKFQLVVDGEVAEESDEWTATGARPFARLVGMVLDDMPAPGEDA